MRKSIGNKLRPILLEYVKELENNRVPTNTVEEIFFRDDNKTGKQRHVYKVPVELLRFRKDNGRIASDVLSFEASRGTIYENTDLGQSILRGFLTRKDPDKTIELKNSILQIGQQEIAVITADGFLINGNRRKMVLESILEDDPNNKRFRYLKVVILPGPNDTETPPSLKEIEQIENRYQLQQLGKADYYNFDKAISIKRKIDNGMSLEEQLRDDPNFVDLNKKEFNREMKKFENNFLKPLECVERYLIFFGRPGYYNTISAGRSDSRGRWQAFLDYYNSTYKRMKDPKQRKKLDIGASDIKYIEDVAFKIIRQREFQRSNKKLHQIMRDLPKLISNKTARKCLYQIIGKKQFELLKEEIVDEQGNILDERTKDTIWSAKYGEVIQDKVSKAYNAFAIKKVQDTPLDLLEAAFNKLSNNQLELYSIKTKRYEEVRYWLDQIKSRIRELEKQLQNKS